MSQEASRPFFSVITVVRNAVSTIEDCIKSVETQSFRDFEYIVVDSLSDDGTSELISKHLDSIDKYVREKDSGIYDAMNKGLALANGDVVGILNSDDIYAHPRVIADVVQAFSNSSNDAVSTDVHIFSGNPANIVRKYRCTRWKPWMFRIGHQPPHPGFFVRKNCYTRYGFFDTHFRTAADFELLFRFIKANKVSTQFLPYTSVLMRSGGASQQSFSAISNANREVHAALKKHGYFSLLPMIWLKYLIKIFQWV
jgi:glycosyltransferase involved in cell wall biosynthesis